MIAMTAIILSLAFLVFPTVAPNAPYFQGPITGIHLVHNGAAVDSLFVSLAPQGQSCGGLIPCGDTDGTGTWTFHASLCCENDPVYYFTYGGEGYAYHGKLGQIVEVSL